MKPHEWEAIEESKGVYGYHEFRCRNCGEITHIGMDRDYEAPVCEEKNAFKKAALEIKNPMHVIEYSAYKAESKKHSLAIMALEVVKKERDSLKVAIEDRDKTHAEHILEIEARRLRLEADLAIAVEALRPMGDNESTKCPHCSSLYMTHFDYCPIKKALTKIRGKP